MTLQRQLSGALAALIFCVWIGPAQAGPGFRAGITDDPDTLFGGAHWRIPFAVAGDGIFVVQPGADFGLGLNNINFMIRGTAHFAYIFSVAPDVAIYPLLGPSLVLVNFDGGNNNDDTATDVGVDLGVGAQFRQFALEVWFGLSNDVPDITLAVSFNL